MLFNATLLPALSLLAGIIYFGSRKPAYSHLKHTISELGEQGSPVAQWVNYGMFLPVGLLLWVVVMLTDEKAVAGLAACIGIGYVVAAFFPCDVGSPSSGSWRQQLHNVGGAIEYLGGAYWIGQFDSSITLLSYSLVNVGVGAVLVGTVLVSMQNLAWRGLVQRLVEIILFGSLLAAVWPI